MSDDGELRRLRATMDALNQRLADLLHERARLVRSIGAWKREHHVAPIDETREAAMLAELLSAAPADGYGADDLRRIWRAIFAASRHLVTAAN